MANVVVTVTRPTLTAEEREKRMAEIKAATVALFRAMDRQQHNTKGKEKARCPRSKV